MREGLQFAETDTAAKTYRTRKNFSDKKISLTKAAKIYLEKLRRDLGDKRMYKILSAQRYSTLIFAKDTTGSMSDEISAAKAIAKRIISATPESEIDYILSPFNDPSKIYFFTFFTGKIYNLRKDPWFIKQNGNHHTQLVLYSRYTES